MNIFIVAFDAPVQDGKTAIKKHFPEHHFEILENHLWAVGVQKKTTTGADICKVLGISEAGNRAGVVWPLSNYYGFFDGALWQKLNAWQAHESA